MMEVRAQMPDTTERKLKIFVSYSRKDLLFAEELVAGLELAGFEPYLDKHDIAVGEDWEARLGRLIEAADTVVFIISPDSVASPRCAWELDKTEMLGKRLLPVVLRHVEEAELQPRLRRLNHVFFDKPFSFGKGLSLLAKSLNTDLGWIREHTRLGELAARWHERGRAEALLIRGDDIEAAKAWVGRRPKDAPEPTLLQREFIAVSEQAEEARTSKEIEQARKMRQAELEQERLARENAEQKAEAATRLARAARQTTRRTLYGVGAFLATMTVAAAVVAKLYGDLRKSEQHAVEQAAEAIQQSKRASGVITETTRIARQLIDDVLESGQSQEAGKKADLETKIFDRADEIFNKLTQFDKTNETLEIQRLRAQFVRANTLVRQTKYPEALQLAKLALVELDSIRSRPGITISLDNHAWMLRYARSIGYELYLKQRYSEGLDLLNDLLPRSQQLAGNNSSDNDRQLELLLVHYAIGRCQSGKGGKDGRIAAMASQAAAVTIGERLMPAWRMVRLWKEMSYVYDQMGRLLEEDKQTEKALEYLRKSLNVDRDLAQSEPDSARYLRNLRISLRKYRESLNANNQRFNQDELLAIARDLVLKIDARLKTDPANVELKRDLGYAHETVGDLHLDKNERIAAVAAFRRNLETLQAMLNAAAESSELQSDIALAYRKIGDVQIAHQRPTEARTSFLASLKLRQSLADASPSSLQGQRNLAQINFKVAEAEKAVGDAAAALASYKRALVARESALAIIEKGETARLGKPGVETADALGSLAWAALFARDFERALAASERGHGLAPDNLVVETNRLHALMFLGRTGEALELHRRYKGRPLPSQSNKAWEIVIADDFSKFRAAGLDETARPAMSEIANSLGIPAAR